MGNNNQTQSGENDKLNLSKQLSASMLTPKDASKYRKKTIIKKICLTGGPCGGKTTALTTLKEKLSEQGYRVFVVPETASLTVEGGGAINHSQLTLKQGLFLETEMIKTKIYLENYFYKLAKLCNQSSVILCDRGVLDGKAFMSLKDWDSILENNNWSEYQFLNRYDAIIHMVTAAKGAQDKYQLGNNKARYESVQDAVLQDDKLQEAYSKHEKHLIIQNNIEDFNQKVKNVLTQIFNFLNIFKYNSSFPKKFLINNYTIPSNVPFKLFKVEDTFIFTKKQGEYSKIRKFEDEQGKITYTICRVIGDDEKIEQTKQISSRDYMIYYKQRDSNLQTIVKERYIIDYNNKIYTVQKIVNKNNDLTFLFFGSQSKDEEVNIPHFISVQKEVTDDISYSTYELAKAQ